MRAGVAVLECRLVVFRSEAPVAVVVHKRLAGAGIGEIGRAAGRDRV